MPIPSGGLELPLMSGGSPDHPLMESILVAGKRLYSQLLVLLWYCWGIPTGYIGAMPVVGLRFLCVQ
jgi:hypothetical protein